MITYRIYVETPFHGELFLARGNETTLAAALEAAISAVKAVERDIDNRRLPLTFDVQVNR